jgi:hypothetical protein
MNAGVAQLVEHHLAKVRVAGSNPVSRSKKLLGESQGRWMQHPVATVRSTQVDLFDERKVGESSRVMGFERVGVSLFSFLAQLVRAFP